MAIRVFHIHRPLIIPLTVHNPYYDLEWYNLIFTHMSNSCAKTTFLVPSHAPPVETGRGDPAIKKPPPVNHQRPGSLAGWLVVFQELDLLSKRQFLQPSALVHVGMFNLEHRAPKSLQHCRTVSRAWSTKFWKFLYRFLAASVSAKMSLVRKNPRETEETCYITKDLHWIFLGTPW